MKKKRTYTKSPIRAKVRRDRVVMPQAWLKGRTNTRRNWDIKLGDEVIILSGSDKGSIGKVTAVFPQEAKITVEGVNIQKRHQRKPGQEQGEITERAGKIWIWKVALVVEQDGKKVATRIRKNAEGKRVAVKTGTVLD